MTPPKTLSAGIVPVRRIGTNWRLLVLRSYRNWDFPKGVVEAGETPFEAARREAREETGLDDFDFPWGEDYRETLAYAANKVARYYLGETQAVHVVLPIAHELGRPEHDEWRWVTFEEAEDLLPPRLAIVLDWVRTTLENEGER